MAQQGKFIAPKDAKPVAGKIPEGAVTLEVLAVMHENPGHPPEKSEHWEILVQYPDGYEKYHQVAKTAAMDDFLTAVKNQLKGRHGVDAGKLVSALPKTFEGLVGKALIFSGE